MTTGDEGGHVEGAAHRGASPTDEPPSSPGATVAVVGCDPRQGSCFAAVELTQFGHFSQEGGSGEKAHAFLGLKSLRFSMKLLILIEQVGNVLVELEDLSLELAQ